MGQQPAIALMRNSAGAVYPYTSSAINIVSNNFGAAYFYYFYNWQFSSGCESTRVPVVATVHPNPVVDLGADTLVCATGSYVLDAGNTGSAYLWNDNSTTQTKAVTTSGQYHVTVTNSNNCSASDTVSVTISTPPVVNLGNDTAICLGSVLTLDAGNNPGASILWDNFTTSQSRTVTTAGQYYVEVAYNQNCKSTDTITLSINPLPVVDLGNDTAICGTGTITLDAGNPGASYLWNDASTLQTKTINVAGQYHVIVTDANNCASSDTVEVIQLPAPSGNFTVAEGPNGQMTFTATTSNTVSYHWDFGDGNTATVNPTSHQYMANGNYPVTLTIVNECGAESEIIREVSIRNRTVGINDAFDDQQILIYPNPASDKLIVENKGSGNLKSFVIIDALGRTVKTVETKGNVKKTIVDLNGLANGLYTLSLQTPDGKMVRKFTIVK
jgi:PKD domain.